MIRHTAGNLIFFQSPLIPVPHAFSTRTGGVSPPPYDTLNLGRAGEDSRENILENYGRFCAAVGVDREALVFSKQVHGDVVRRVGRAQAGEGLYGRSPECDGLVTDTPGLPLAVFWADCVPVLLYDPAQRAVGAVHAGWRGTALGVVRRAVEAMGELFGAKPSELRAAIGPCVGACCFETKSDVPVALLSAWGATAEAHIRRDGPDRFHVDLKGLNAALLADTGLPPAQIDLSDACTRCRPELFFSHRRSGAQRGLQAAVISIPSE